MLLANALELTGEQRREFEAAARSTTRRRNGASAIDAGSSREAATSNLPRALSSFVGREVDLAEVSERLGEHRLLTIAGAGGVGKTRLAIQTGTELRDRYPDGVWFVDFAPITDPELVASLVAQALGMSQQPGRPIDEAISAWLKRKRLLLILDNCEHVLATVAALAATILESAHDVRILATSRERLNIRGEAVHRLPSLAVPPKGSGLTADEAARYGAVALFIDRAEAADTRFTLADANAPIVAEICRRLDGIPLAIELAAARVRVLSIPNLSARLDERFKILTGGSRGAIPRQQTLTALIDWSYDLLAPHEQRFFMRLGTFSGGFGLDAVEAVCRDESIAAVDAFDLLASLADKSLVIADTSDERERYRLLESTSAYALEKLKATGERERFARRHAEHFCERAETADEGYGSGSTIEWLGEVEPELPNYRAALEWALTQGRDPVLGGAIAGALQPLWWHAGLVVEGRYWIEHALPRIDAAEHPAIAARLQLALSQLLSGKRRSDAAERALQLYESVGNVRGAARARQRRGFALYQMGRLAEARDEISQAVAALHGCGDAWNVANGLGQLAYIETMLGNLREGRELRTKAIAGMQALGDDAGIARVLGNLAELEFAAGNPEQALRLEDEALKMGLLGRNLSIAANWQINGVVYRVAVGDLAGAREAARKGLELARQVQGELILAVLLQHMALLAALGDRARSGARLMGYADAQYAKLEMKREPTEQWGYDKLMLALCEALDANAIEQLAAEGAAWSEEQAIETALTV